MVNAQKYLDEKYPNKEERKNVIKLDFSILGQSNTFFSSKKRLEGHLDLSDFVNLTDFRFYYRQFYLTKITYPPNYIQRRWSHYRNVTERYYFLFHAVSFKEIKIPLTEIVNISDLDEWVKNYDCSKIGNSDYHKFVGVGDNNLFLVLDDTALDNLANQVLARYIIVTERLYCKKSDLDFEKEIIRLSLGHQKCYKMLELLKERGCPYVEENFLSVNVNVNEEFLPSLFSDLPWFNLKPIIQALNTQISTLTTEKNELSTQLATLTGEKSTLESILTENQGKCTTLESTLAENQTTISTLKKTKGELEINLSNLQTSKNNLETELKGKISTLENEKRELEKENSNLQSQLLTLATNRDTLNEQITSLTDEKNTLAQKLAEYDRIRDETLERIKAGKLLPDPKEEHLRAKYKEAYETNEHLRSLIRTYEIDKVGYHQTLENWQKQISDLEAKRDAKTTELNNLTIKHSQTEKELTKSQANYRELEAKEQNTSQQLTNKTAELEQERKNYSELQTSEKNTSEQLSQKTTELERTSQELANTSRELETTQTNLTNQINQTAELQAKLNEKETKLKDLNEKLESKNNNLQTQSAILNSLIAKAQEIKIKLEKSHQRADSLLNPKTPRQIFLEKYWPAFLLIPITFLLSLLITKNFKSKKKTPKPVVKSTEKPEKANEPISEIPTEKTFLQLRNSKGQFTKKNP